MKTSRSRYWRIKKYAHYARDILFQYEVMYKVLPLHPQELRYASMCAE